MGLQLPGVVGYNPPMWDRVISSPTSTIAVALTASGKAKMKNMGWLDAVGGETCKFNNPWYNAGFDEGLSDLQA